MYGAVAFLDAMGFKGIWRRHKPDRVLAKLAQVADRIRKLETILQTAQAESGEPWYPRVQVLFVSDSIFITCGHYVRRSDQPDFEVLLATSIHTVALLAGMAMVYGLENADNEVPLIYRGTIAVGEFLASSGDLPFIVGAPVDAAVGAEKYAQGAFVWLTPEARDVYFEHLHGKKTQDSRILRPYLLPMKEYGEYETFVVNPLNSRIIHKDSTQHFLDALTSFIGRDTLELAVKLDNTLRFYGACLEEDEDNTDV